MSDKLSYRPTFSQFVDNYLATYYSGGVQTFRRVASGPALALLGSLTIILAFQRLNSWLLRGPIILVGLVLALYGLFYTLGPLFNVFLVWLRRKQLFNEKSLTTMELEMDHLSINQNGDKINLPFAKIKSVQHRAASTWILTHSDTLIYIPREGLQSGNHDQFIQALEEKIAPKEKGA